jgi:hypothetical protein
MNQRRVTKLNRLMLQELGENPPYSWQWSEDLTWGVLTGTEPYASDTGLILRRPVYTMRKRLVTVDRRWLICFKAKPMPERAWLKLFGWQCQWPNCGLWTPLATPVRVTEDSKPVGGTAMLDSGEEPDETITREVIALVKELRVKTSYDRRQEIEDAQDLRIKRRDDLLYAKIRDRIPAFGGGRPGEKSHWVPVLEDIQKSEEATKT